MGLMKQWALLVALMGVLLLSPSEVVSSSIDLLTASSEPATWTPIQHSTILGTIEGRLEETEGQNRTHSHYYAFRGIPYAKPPVEDLRWRDPVAVEDRWPGGHLDASQFKPSCPQFHENDGHIAGSEDCLYLNIFTPNLPSRDDKTTKKLLPVFVFIHGGGFLRGSSSSHGAARLLANDLVLVTLNYRLGALGFLSTGDDTIAGNFGMLDQVTALKWVQRNIAQFGGNPDKVTIGGFSAGGASVHFHTLSPQSTGLFHGAILMSGCASCSWAVQEYPQTYAHRFASELGCPSASHAELRKCIMLKSTDEVLKAQTKMHRYVFWPVAFSVVVDGGLREEPFLPLPVEDLSPRTSVPVLMGMVPNEGLLFALGIVLTSKDPNNAASVYDESVQYIVRAFLPHSTADTVARVAETLYYTPKSRDSINTLVEEMTEALSDYLFLSCVWDTAVSYANSGSRVYGYVMTHREPRTRVWAEVLYQLVREMGMDTPILNEGVSHGDDMLHVFTFPRASDFLGIHASQDQVVTHFMTSAWANFVMHGEPRTTPTWEPMSRDTAQPYMNISVDPVMVREPFKAKSQNFWRQTIPLVTAGWNTGLHRQSTETCPGPDNL